MKLFQNYNEKLLIWINGLRNTCIVKAVLSGHSKIDKTKVLKTDVSFMQVHVESIAECILKYF